MDISIDNLATELEVLARRESWDNISVRVTREYQEQGGGDLLEPIEIDGSVNLTARHNNKQRIQRAFRGSSQNYRDRAEELKPYVLAALPCEQRAKLTIKKSPQYIASMLNADFAVVMSAILLGCSETTQKINKFSDSLHSILPIVQQMIS